MHGVGPWEFGWTARYTSAMQVSDDLGLIASQGNGGKVDAQLYHDVFVLRSMRFRGADLTLRLDGHNIGKTKGPHDASEGYYINRYWDSEWHLWRASVTARF